MAHTAARRPEALFFYWILGVLLACAFGIINAMWLEQQVFSQPCDNEEKKGRAGIA